MVVLLRLLGKNATNMFGAGQQCLAVRDEKRENKISTLYQNLVKSLALNVWSCLKCPRMCG
eukprot:3385970-Amphidinium_carterae.1